MNRFFDKTKEISLRVIKFICKTLLSMVAACIVVVLIKKYHSFSSDGSEFLSIMGLTVLLYWLFSHIKIPTQCCDFLLAFSKIIPITSKKLKGKAKILLLESKLNEESLLDLKELDTIISSVKAEYGFDNKKIRKYLLETLINTISDAIDEGGISEELEENIEQLCSYCDFTAENNPGVFSELKKGLLLREISAGNLPHITIHGGTLPFNFLKDEKLIWCEQNTQYHTIKDQVYYEGGSTGYSLRIAKGVYVRQNAYKGAPVHTQSLELEDEGIFAITNKHIYFGGIRNRFRIPYHKILSYEPYKDAVLIQKDAASSKPMFFSTSNADFICNLIANISQHGEDYKWNEPSRTNQQRKESKKIQYSALKLQDNHTDDDTNQKNKKTNLKKNIALKTQNTINVTKKIKLIPFPKKKTILIGGVILLSIACIFCGRIYFTKKLNSVTLNWLPSTHYTAKEEILSLFTFKQGDLLSQIDINKLSDDMKNLPWIRDVQVKRNWGNGGLEINIVEKIPLVVWQHEHKYYPLDEKGEVIRAGNKLPADLMLIVGSDAPQHLLSLLHDLEQVPEIYQYVRAAIRVGGKRWNLKLYNAEHGLEILLPEQNVLEALQRLDYHNKQEKLLKRQIAAIDLRTKDKIILKPLKQ